jgi:capsid protein
MTEDGTDQMDPPSPKLVAALLRDARSVSRRADKLGADVAAVQDPTIQELAAQASNSIDQLVHQLPVVVNGPVSPIVTLTGVTEAPPAAGETTP